ncbi:MAG: HlyC/CorC family transporter [Victivallales bacterium]|nr:HlyC/CorC family transporter [Victivallales bacterium]
MLDTLTILILIIILLCFSAFFSGSETAMMTLSKPQIKRMEHGDGREPLVFRLLKDPQHLLATILVGNMFVNTLLTLLCALFTNRIAHELVAHITAGSLQDDKTQELISILLNIAIVTPLIMVFGELTPKSVAHRQAVTFARLSARPLDFAGRAMRPILWIFQCAVNAVQWCLFIPRDSHWDMLTQAEVDATLTASVQNGTASLPARELLGRIFKFNDIEAAEIMIPRVTVEAIDDSLTLGEAFAKIKDSPHGTIPVYHEDMDDIWGVAIFADYPKWINHPDADKKLATFREALESGNATTELPVYPIDFIPPTLKIPKVLEQMKAKPQRVNVVVGEYGETLGILTVNSILDEIIGRFSGNNQADDKIDVNEEGVCVIRGMTRRKLVEEALHEDFGDMESDTVGGLIVEGLGHVPTRNEHVDLGRHRFIVVSMNPANKKQVERVSIIPIPQKHTNNEEHGGQH